MVMTVKRIMDMKTEEEADNGGADDGSVRRDRLQCKPSHKWCSTV